MPARPSVNTESFFDSEMLVIDNESVASDDLDHSTNAAEANCDTAPNTIQEHNREEDPPTSQAPAVSSHDESVMSANEDKHAADEPNDVAPAPVAAGDTVDQPSADDRRKGTKKAKEVKKPKQKKTAKQPVTKSRSYVRMRSDLPGVPGPFNPAIPSAGPEPYVNNRHPRVDYFCSDGPHVFRSPIQRYRQKIYAAMGHLCGHGPESSCYRCVSYTALFIPQTPEDAAAHILILVGMLTVVYMATAIFGLCRSIM